MTVQHAAAWYNGIINNVIGPTVLDTPGAVTPNGAIVQCTSSIPPQTPKTRTPTIARVHVDLPGVLAYTRNRIDDQDQ